MLIQITHLANEGIQLSMHIHLKNTILAFTIGAACCLSGCGERETRLPTHKVVGKVTQKGVGLANATIVFHAKQPPDGFIKPRATTNANGEFELTTYEAGDGAPVGEYELTVERWLFESPEVGAKNRLPSKLGSPSTSGLKATVAAMNNMLPPIEVR